MCDLDAITTAPKYRRDELLNVKIAGVIMCYRTPRWNND
jgi:hypothetical protein